MHNANKVPRHIGFIMDGNGRWAKERLLPRTHGHVKGANNVEKIVDHCFKKGVEVVSLYAFSTENWQRPEKEVNKIFSILENFLNKYIVKLKKHEIRLMFSGDLTKLSPALQELCLKRVEETKYFGNGIVNIALNYGSRQEIIKACKIAEIYDYIEALPNGIDTILSEKGSGLSEGQLQRIAIARAIVAQSPILLLDEATSALDKPTEAKVLKNIKDMADKTVILVTHRTSNLNLCDNIINLSE
jgi:undecaprenyl diphosphate synthase